MLPINVGPKRVGMEGEGAICLATGGGLVRLVHLLPTLMVDKPNLFRRLARFVLS